MGQLSLGRMGRHWRVGVLLLLLLLPLLGCHVVVRVVLKVSVEVDEKTHAVVALTSTWVHDRITSLAVRSIRHALLGHHGPLHAHGPISRTNSLLGALHLRLRCTVLLGRHLSGSEGLLNTTTTHDRRSGLGGQTLRGAEVRLVGHARHLLVLVRATRHAIGTREPTPGLTAVVDRGAYLRCDLGGRGRHGCTSRNSRRLLLLRLACKQRVDVKLLSSRASRARDAASTGTTGGTNHGHTSGSVCLGINRAKGFDSI